MREPGVTRTRISTRPHSFEVVADLARPVDKAAIEERVAGAAPPIGDRGGIDSVLSCCDVTSLEVDDTPEGIARLAARAREPVPGDPSVPHAAALCTWAHLVPSAREVLEGSGVKVAAVAGDFPTGRASVEQKVAEITDALARGAEEIDAVMDRSAVQEGRLRDAYSEVVAFRAASVGATLKVIVETGELDGLDLIRTAGLVALAGGADMVKTSTGKTSAGASPHAALVLLDALADFREETGRPAGLKVAGGVRETAQALHYAALVRAEMGSEGVTPRRFRIGASSLLDELVKAL